VARDERRVLPEKTHNINVVLMTFLAVFTG